MVVIGYQSIKRRDVSGTVSSIQGKDLEKIPVSSAAEALTGRLPGVQVMPFRWGARRWNCDSGAWWWLYQDNSPLYIVDGFPVSSLNDISPSDIASIDILKDAATAGDLWSKRRQWCSYYYYQEREIRKTVISIMVMPSQNPARELKVLSPTSLCFKYEYTKTEKSIRCGQFY